MRWEAINNLLSSSSSSSLVVLTVITCHEELVSNLRLPEQQPLEHLVDVLPDPLGVVEDLVQRDGPVAVHQRAGHQGVSEAEGGGGEDVGHPRVAAAVVGGASWPMVQT